ncbi:glycosyltransferase [Algoriphagus sp. C2-6-M1]|uniref:glycosyltransferase n=1 Tax=Algoriphagus persicinus TaxID=3108754 RepID=UPI002B3F809B|nr:glycosyltransferase [Algoriphagus sp. C2-6-M1]MEB2782428.1 glycosyltransferase [Algoriphagus sp. C2-6-M1]
MEEMRICITSTEQSAYSETFITNLIEVLPGQIHHCYGGFIPNESNDKLLNNYKKAPLFDSALVKLGLIKRSLKQHYFLKYLKKERFDLLLVNYGTAGAELAPLAKASNTPIIVHFHGYDASVKTVLKRYKQDYRVMFEIAKAIVVVSKEMENDLINLGAPKEKIYVLACAPNKRFFNIQPNYASNQILAIGRFVEKKAPYLTLLAFKKAKETCPLLSLVFIGDGHLLPVCKDLQKSLGIDDVSFSGVLTPDEIAVHMSNSFCFVQHSKQASSGDKEGTPVAILEALAAGLPIISTRHAGIPDVVLEGQNGFLVDEGDIEGMSNNLVKIYQDRKLAETLGKSSKEKFAKQINTDFYRKSWVELIEIL